MAIQSPGFVGSVLRGKSHSFPEHRGKERVLARQSLRQPARCDRQEGQGRARPYAPEGLSIASSGLQLGLSALGHQTKVDVAVGPCLAPAMRPKQHYRLQGKRRVHGREAPGQRLALLTKGRREVVQQELHLPRLAGLYRAGNPGEPGHWNDAFALRPAPGPDR